MIPAWTMAGVLPPVRPGVLGHSSDRSPYVATLHEVVGQFATSPQRITILIGLLNYRAALQSIGITSGFQWLDGSFMQDVELHESRAPRDIDVVTYFYLPAGETQSSLAQKAGALFSNGHVKATYSIDAYPHVLDGQMDEHKVRQISYWYSMWSHRRDGLWKGFVQVSMNPQEDYDASLLLNALQVSGAAP